MSQGLSETCKQDHTEKQTYKDTKKPISFKLNKAIIVV